jgi:hypothetical protein
MQLEDNWTADNDLQDAFQAIAVGLVRANSSAAKRFAPLRMQEGPQRSDAAALESDLA